MEFSPNIPMSERERSLMDLLRRLLCLYENLKAENKHLRDLLRRVTTKHQVVCQQHATQAEATDVLIGAAMDELLGRGQGPA